MILRISSDIQQKNLFSEREKLLIFWKTNSSIHWCIVDFYKYRHFQSQNRNIFRIDQIINVRYKFQIRVFLFALIEVHLCTVHPNVTNDAIHRINRLTVGDLSRRLRLAGAAIVLKKPLPAIRIRLFNAAAANKEAPSEGKHFSCMYVLEIVPFAQLLINISAFKVSATRIIARSS